MKIEIILSTRGRPEKLLRMIKSVSSKENDVSLLVGFDGDFPTFSRFSKMGSPVPTECVFFENHQGAVAVRNALSARTTDAVLYATDDITFRPDAIDIAAATGARLFPDGDGVVGFWQDGNKFHPSGVALILSEFMKRYPERKIHFPGYYHFAAQEVYQLANLLGRFHLEKNAKIYHFHPSTHQAERDWTHIEARKFKSRDERLKKERESRGEIWGK